MTQASFAEIIPPGMPEGPIYAGFWIRALAHVVDNVILTAVFFPLAPSPVIFGLWWLYYAVCESSPWQATLGKKLCSLRVVDLNGDRLTFPRATGRFFAKILSFCTAGFGFVMIGFTLRKQGLHDLIADTLVLRSTSVKG